MRVRILGEYGYEYALLGLSLSYDCQRDMTETAIKLSDKDGGHNKFLESIVAWLDITAPRYWWQQFDTYRVGITKQSGSTMHTLMKRELEQSDFEKPIAQQIMNRLNELIRGRYFEELKNELPEGFLQRRIICVNYKTLRNMIEQRKHHRLSEWRIFIESLSSLEHEELLCDSGQALLTG